MSALLLLLISLASNPPEDRSREHFFDDIQFKGAVPSNGFAERIADEAWPKSRELSSHPESKPKRRGI
ncbi:hypothetical protein J2N86_15665 (plasmid) [Legionella lytica]|uniref:Secreted protein n=1 Tax=Legionella lytica TaxID=96232 RepID=A0ABY4YD64_9GAMM|nr:MULTISPECIES: hypothetical protein [Legionella]USQ15583.1 hypothetical protein J2N86_15665 [Legionella lytica]